MQYRRANTPGAAYFFTVFTDQRQNLFHTPETVACLRQVFRTVKVNHPFTIEAIAALVWCVP